MTDNVVAIALETAEKHMDNPAVVTLYGKLKTAQMMVRAQSSTFDMLTGYRKGAAGEDGYGLLFNLDADMFKPMMREMSALREVTVVTECLVAVLNALGEEISY